MFLLAERANGGTATEDTNTTERRKTKTQKRGRTMAENPHLMVRHHFKLITIKPAVNILMPSHT